MGGPQHTEPGPRALSQPGSPQQLGDRFQGDAGSGVHGGLAQQQLMGNRCEGALCRSGPGGTGVGTSLPAPVALPPRPLGALAGPCTGWGEEAAPDLHSQLGWALRPPGAAQKLHWGLFQKNNLSGRYFTYINIHLYDYVQRQREPGRQRGSCPETLPPKHWPKPSFHGRCHGQPRQCLPQRDSGSCCTAMPGRSQPRLKAQC